MNNQWASNNSTSPPASMNQATRRRLILTARDEAVRVLTRKLADTFELLDEALFEQAEKAASDALKNNFMHAARELRLLQLPISNEFMQGAEKNFDKFFSAESATQTTFSDSVQERSKDTLALLKYAELEEDLAISTIIAKGEKRYQNALEQLNALWASFTGRRLVTNADNPLGPESLAEQFRMALVIWSGEQAVKPFVYSEFYEHVIAHLGDLYQKLIDEMRAAGVHPVDKRTQRRSGLSTDSAQSYAVHEGGAGLQAENTEQQQGDTAETNILGLVALVRRLIDPQRQTLGLTSTRPISEPQMQPLRPARLASILAQLQQQFADGAYDDLQTALESNGEFKRTLHDKLVRLEEQHQQVHALDQHIIDVVMMLFDFVLEDSAMPAPMKVILARLQIPVLQVALHDRSFLSSRSHPVRMLLNNLSRAAIRWLDDGDHTASSMYGMINQSVDRIVATKDQTAELYADVNQEFSNYLHREDRAAKLAEQRLNQVTRGQEQLAAAREKVSGQLDIIMNDMVPVAVYRILNEAWRDVLTLTLLREGEGSVSWVKMVKVAERLIDSTVPRTQEWERQKIMRDIPLLLADLREGFFSISYDSAKTAAMLKQLQLCHISVLRGLTPQMQSYPQKEQHEQLIADTEIVVSDSSKRAAEAVDVGQWLNWTHNDGREVRAKLSWRSEIADLLLFVDSRGRKVIEMTLSDLSDLFQNNEARIIQEIDEPIMDRAMRIVYNTLRQTVSQGQTVC